MRNETFPTFPARSVDLRESPSASNCSAPRESAAAESRRVMSRASVRFVVVAVALLLLASDRMAWSCCQLGSTVCGDPYAINCNNGVVCFPPFRLCASSTCTSTLVGQTCLATTSEPGTVFTLRLRKNALTEGNLDLSWDPSCSPYASDYSVHEGALGSWYSHTPVGCSSGGALSMTITPRSGNRYYLVAPISGSWTGSFGTNSTGAERPDADSPCTTDRAIAPCP